MKKDRPSIYYWTELAALILLSVEAIYIYDMTIGLLEKGVSPTALTAIAVAALGVPAALLGRWYQHNSNRYKCKNERDIQLSQSKLGEENK